MLKPLPELLNGIVITVVSTAVWARVILTLRSRYVFFFSSRRRHTRLQGDWSSDVCSSDLIDAGIGIIAGPGIRMVARPGVVDDPGMMAVSAWEGGPRHRSWYRHGGWPQHEIGRASCRERV